MRSIRFAVFTLGLPAALAAQSPPPDYSELSGAALEQASQAMAEKPGTTWCDMAPFAAEMYRRWPERVGFQAWAGRTSALCAAMEGRGEEALSTFLTIQEFESGDAHLGMQLAVNAQDADAALRFLRDALLSAPAAPRQIQPEILPYALRYLEEEGRGEAITAYALEAVASGRLESLERRMAIFASVRSLKPAIAGDRTLVPAILRQIDSPTFYVDYLARREYEPIWPLLETRVGPHFTVITDEHLRNARRAHVENENDSDTVNALAHALFFDGRFEETVQFLDAWRRQSPSGETVDEDVAWAVNLAAYALDGLGRRDESDARFDAIGTLDPEASPWVVSFAINRASRLVGQGRWEEGLEANVLGRRAAEIGGNEYARSLVALNQVCALAGLERAGEAAPDLAFLLEKGGDFAEVPAQALLCLGRREEAVQQLLAALGTEGGARRLAVQLQPEPLDLFGTKSTLPNPRDLVASDDRVRAAFEAVARIVPEPYYPAASLKRLEVQP